MKVAFIGGGSHRYLSVARSVLAEEELFEGGEISVYDLNHTRSQAMRRMIENCPEKRDVNCVVSSPDNLDSALEGADVVIVVLFAGNRKNFLVSQQICGKHGFIGSDQLSPSGAMLALKGAPILLNIAKRMEELCPNAFLLDFANPVAVLSAAVNNHTKIKCMGICAGYTNHMWDIARILGKDECCSDHAVNCAGVNHMSFILKDSIWEGANLYEQLEAATGEGWQMPELSLRWQQSTKDNINFGIPDIVRLYKKIGHMIFSSEGDGIDHLDIAGRYARGAAKLAAQTESEIDASLAAELASRQKQDEKFQSLANSEISDDEWNAERPETLYLSRDDQNIMVKVIKALGGAGEMRIATSVLNNGAVEGYTDRTVLEYTQFLDENGSRPAGKFKVPDMVYGLVADLAAHQTLLGDAIATKDPRILYDAFYNYPVQRDTMKSKALWSELLELNAEELPKSFQATKEYLNK